MIMKIEHKGFINVISLVIFFQITNLSTLGRAATVKNRNKETLKVDEISRLARRIEEEYETFETITLQLFDKNGKKLNSTLLQDAAHLPQLNGYFTAFEEKFSLNLVRNGRLFGNEYVEKVVTGDKVERFSSQEPKSIDSHCFYHGHLNENLKTSLALSTCDGLRGMIFIEEENFYIEPVDVLTGVHRIYKGSKETYNFSCGHSDESAKHFPLPDDEVFKTNIQDRKSSYISEKRKLKRSADSRSRDLILPHTGGKPLRVLELYVVTDFAEYHAMEAREDKLVQRVKDIVNIVSSGLLIESKNAQEMKCKKLPTNSLKIYQQLGIYVVLVGIEMWTERNLIEINGNADQTMNAFIDYRKNFINPRHKNDNAQLIIGRELGEGVLGKAPIMTICTHQYSGGVSADRSTSLGQIATTVAHELGHNFGMGHDDGNCHCPDDRCIMSSSGSGRRNPTRWSDCSRQKMEDAIHQGMDYCLRDAPQTLYRGASCGNGFTEEGEECDCGLEEDCANKCCDARTCTLKSNATCASGWCCDLSTCKPKSFGTECRAAGDVCDLAEYCNGESEHCPSDVHKMDSTKCSVRQSEAYCYKGKCNTLDSQCRLLWGRTGESSHPLCYEHFNIMGNANGHCGYSWIDRTFQKCQSEDVMCGMIHCQHRSEKMMFWKEALVLTLPDSYVTVDGRREDCKAAILDVGLDMPDPSIALDGVKCGDEKMCVSHRCKKISEVPKIECGNCNNHGVCNSVGQCHCDFGYAPPYCDRRGYGGSEHSGPASDTTVNVALAVSLSVLIIALIIIAAVVVHTYKRKDRWRRLFIRKWSFRIQKYSSVARGGQNGRSMNKSTSKEAVDLHVTTPDSSKPKVKPVTKVTRAASMSAKIGRTITFRPQDISNPTLQSSTNDLVEQLPSIDDLSSDSIFDQTSSSNLLKVHSPRGRTSSITRSSSSAARLMMSTVGDPVLLDNFRTEAETFDINTDVSVSNRLKNQVKHAGNVKDSQDSVENNSCNSLGGSIDDNSKPLLKNKQKTGLNPLLNKSILSNAERVIAKAKLSNARKDEAKEIKSPLKEDSKSVPPLFPAYTSIANKTALKPQDSKSQNSIQSAKVAETISQTKTKPLPAPPLNKTGDVKNSSAPVTQNINNVTGSAASKDDNKKQNGTDSIKNVMKPNIEAVTLKSFSNKGKDEKEPHKPLPAIPVPPSFQAVTLKNTSNKDKTENESQKTLPLRPKLPPSVEAVKSPSISAIKDKDEKDTNKTLPHRPVPPSKVKVMNNTFTARDHQRPPALRNNTFTAPGKQSAPVSQLNKSNDSNVAEKTTTSNVRALINKVEPKLTHTVSSKDSDFSTLGVKAKVKELETSKDRSASNVTHSESFLKDNTSIRPALPKKPN